MSLKTALVRGVLKMAGMDSASAIQAILGPVVQAPRLGSKQLLEAYNTMPWLRAGLSRVSWSVSAVPWQLFVATEKPSDADKAMGRRMRAVRNRALQRCADPKQRMKMYKALRRDDSLREITSHQALDVLDRGNPKMSGNSVKQLTQQYLDLVGEGLWIIERNALKVPTEIWPIPPTWVSLMPTSNNPNYQIAAPTGTRTIPADDIIYFRHPNPADPYNRSAGLGHALGDELETDESAAKHLKLWFKNRARPDILVTAEGLRKEEISKLEDGWLAKLSGQVGVNKPHFINRKVQVDVLSQTFQEMQLSDLRKDERDIILHVIGMPPEILGIIENSNRSTIDAADYLFAKYVLVPRLEFLRTTLQLYLIERYDERLILDYINPVMEDEEFELKVRQVAPWAWTKDEWREMGGSAPSTDGSGDLYAVPFNLTFTDDLASLSADVSLPEPEPAPAPAPAPAPTDNGA